MRRFPLPSAATVIAVLALLTATTGASYAGGILTGKDIKNHSIGLIDLQKSAVHQLHGAKGVPGKRGARGHRGLPGAAASTWYTGHVTSLAGAEGTTDYFSPVGSSTAEASTSEFVDDLGPTIATTITSLSVVVQNAPDAGSQRNFYFVVGGTTSSDVCTVVAGASSCTVSMSLPLSATTFYLEGDVVNAAAGGSDASFSWTTSG
jgi:hypothetical protein